MNSEFSGQSTFCRWRQVRGFAGQGVRGLVLSPRQVAKVNPIKRFLPVGGRILRDLGRRCRRDSVREVTGACGYSPSAT